MYFDYEQYYVECLINPIAVMLLCLSALVYGCIFLIKKPYKRTDMNLLVGLLIFGFMLCLQVGCLLNGGIHLFQEKGNDAVKTTGYISYIGALSEFEMPRVSTEYESHGIKRAEFHINDICCKAPVKGDLKVGDYVEVEYLPKSGYILCINRVEPEMEMTTEKEYYTLEDFQSIVVGESTLRDVEEIAPIEPLYGISTGLMCEYPMENGDYICIKFSGEESIVDTIKVHSAK